MYKVFKFFFAANFQKHPAAYFS